MHGPASPGWLLVALCAATGAYCLLRMRSAVEEQRRTAGGEAVMGFGMAAMAVPAAVAAPPHWAWLGYVAVFGAAAVRALWAARGGRHHLHHLVGACAMVYMAAVMAASPGHHHAHGGSGVPLVTGALLVYFTAYVLLSGFRLLPVAAVAAGTGSTGSTGTTLPGPARPPGWGDRPELSRACRLSMGIAMLAMLVTL
ncbi:MULTISPECIES: DUF5134 domain-containing protein [unclassified Streptomyces]|uniref:DUF5134 domain-containing protein n=1 Tax=unclassified Streptomyces TaxID=2593676 RepID=UPI0038013671|nr:DUF5134 domain-containing protein [Streptomyces sp. NBC_01176]